ncbi:hypothetical protein RJ641_008598 [Dillenia turbinata]|uniref:Uncharacterized protein n=1 Tax=Dillenia turbinata TaxID=194707 RepID=A0AAN8Z551_9MAGN
MASTCIQSCVADARVPVRATYVNLYKWPESDAEFVKSVKSSSHVRRDRGVGGYEFNHPRVVDSISCRQLYLRSYTFSRKETVPEKTKKCLDKVKDRVVNRSSGKRKTSNSNSKPKIKRKCVVIWKAKEVTCTALMSVFRRLLFCTTQVDVADH